MKISPTAIRQKFFETAFRGFEKKQVTDFLEEISEIMQKINQENLELRSKLQLVEGESKRLKDVEDSLFRTLKTAEDTGNAIINEATEAADQIIAEANQIAESTTSRAYQYAEQLKKQADEHARYIASSSESKAKEIFKEINQRLQGLIQSHNELIEQRAALIMSMKKISQDTLNQIELSEAHFSPIDSGAYQHVVEELANSGQFTSTTSPDHQSSLKPSIPYVEDEPESQFDENLSSSHLDDETKESIEALKDELKEQGELPGEEEQDKQPASSSEPLISTEAVDKSIGQKKLPDSPPSISIRSTGSFFDQLD